MSFEKPTSPTDFNSGLADLKARLERMAESADSPSDRIEILLDDQRNRFQSGNGIDVERYFEMFPEFEQGESTAVDLIYNEYLLRNEQGEAQSQQDFLVRFPRHAHPLDKQFQVYNALNQPCPSSDDSLTVESRIDDRDHSQPVTQTDRGDSIPRSADIALYQQYLDSERFQIDSVVGEGTFAIVVKAWDHSLQRWVAIKFARNSFDRDSIEFERFSREAASAAGMAHPGVVGVFEFRGKVKHPYIVQEFVSGGTLKRRMQRRDYSFSQAAQWIAKVGDAIEYAHQFGIVHRDIKPENILFDDRHQPKVADFGLAGLADRESQLTHQGDLLGTPAYMSPEQASGQPVGPPSDIYSLGVVMYELLFQMRPFSGSAHTVLQQVVHQKPTPPADSSRIVPQDLQIICLKAMSKDPDRRYSSAQEMSQDIRRFLSGSPILARPIGTFEKTIRWCVNQPAFALTILLAATALFVLGAISMFRINYERHRFREQRDIANTSLYQSLVKTAETRLSAKKGDWYKHTMQDIRKAARLDPARTNPKPVQQLLLETLSDTSVRFDKGNTWQGIDQPVTSIDVDAKEIAVGYTNGQAILMGSQLSGLSIQLNGATDKIRKIALDRKHQSVYGLAGHRLFHWSIPDELARSVGTDIEFNDDPPEVKGTVIADDVSEFALGPENSVATARLAIATRSGSLDLYPGPSDATDNPTMGEPVCLEQSAHASCLGFSRSGMLLIAGFKNRTIRTWDVANGNVIDEFKTAIDPPVSVSIDRMDRQVDWTTRVSYTIETYRSGNYLRSKLLPGAVVQVDRVQCPAGDMLVGGTEDGSVVLFDGVQTELARVKNRNGLSCMAVSPDTATIVVGNDSGTINQLSIVQSAVAIPFNSIHDLAFTPDSKLIVDARQINLDAAHPPQPLDRVSITCMDSGDRIKLLAGTRTGDIHLKRFDDSSTYQNYQAHAHRIVSIQLGTSEDWYATADRSGAIKIWDSVDDTCLQAIESELGNIFQIACHPKLELLVVIGETGAACCSITEQGQSHTPWKPLGADNQALTTGSVDLSSETICVGSGQRIQLFGVESFQPLVPPIELRTPVRRVKFAPDGKSVFALANASVGRWDLNGDRRFTCKCNQDGGLLAIDPNSTWIAIGSPTGTETSIHDFENGQRLANFPQATDTRAVKFSARGDIFWMGFQGVVRYDRDSLAETIESKPRNATAEFTRSFVFEIPGASWNAIWSTATSPDGSWIASGRHDRHVTIRNADTLRIERILDGYSTEVWCCEFSPDSRLLATGTEGDQCGEIVIWNARKWTIDQRIQCSKRLIAGLSFHPTAPWLAVSSFDGSVVIVDYRTGETLQSLLPSLPTEKRLSAGAMDIEFSRDGRWLAAARKAQAVSVWAVDPSARQQSNDPTKTELAVAPHLTPIQTRTADERIWAVAFDARSNLLATASESGQVDLFRVGSYQHLVSVQTGRTRLRAIEFSPDGRFLATSAWTSHGIAWNLELMEKELQAIGLPLDLISQSSTRSHSE